MRRASTPRSLAFVVAIAAALWFAVPTAQAPATYKAPRSPHKDGSPNLIGIWQAMNSANWDLEGHNAKMGPVPSLGAVFSQPAGQSVVVGGDIPYKPEALAKKKENAAHWVENDPLMDCFLPGVPRANYLPYPFEIIQSPNVILFSYAFQDGARRVLLGNTAEAKAHEEAPFDQWMGWSRGKWDGDTLVVDVRGFHEETWFDHAGNYHSDELHVTERYTPISPDHLDYEATIDDPKVFTRPWKINFVLYRVKEKNAQLLEYKCTEFVEERRWGHLVKK